MNFILYIPLLNLYENTKIFFLIFCIQSSTPIKHSYLVFVDDLSSLLLCIKKSYQDRLRLQNPYLILKENILKVINIYILNVFFQSIRLLICIC